MNYVFLLIRIKLILFYATIENKKINFVRKKSSTTKHINRNNEKNMVCRG